MVAVVDDVTAPGPGSVWSGSVPPGPLRLRRLGLAALGFSVALNVASMAVPALIDHPLTTQRGEVRLYLDVFEEGNLPTWWSSALLVTAALAHAVTGTLARVGGARAAWPWFVSAGVLGALSLDDHTALHERLERIGRQVVTFERFPAYWLLPGVLVAAVVAAALLLLAVRLHGTARRRMVAGCLLLLGCAIGGDLLQSLLYAAGESGPLYVLTYHGEELGENVGVLLMLAAAVGSLTVARQRGGITVDYGGGAGHR